MSFREKVLRILLKFGIRNQLKKLSEETYEVQEAINDISEFPISEDHKKHIEEEVADCSVLLNQFIEYFNLDRDRIEENINYKIDRTLKRIEEGYYDR